MSSTLIEPEMETFPNRYRWTTEACYRLRELGFLEGRYELLDGEIIDKMGQNPPHASTLTRVASIFARLFGFERIRIQSPITLPGSQGVHNEPEPDVAITREPEVSFGDRHPFPMELLLVIEVSDTTLQTDLLVKARLYARAGISEYWALDLTSRQLHIHKEPENGEYTSVTIHAETESAAPSERPDAFLKIRDMLPPLDD